MRTTTDWLRQHPWIGVAFLSGVLIGVVVCLPIIPFEFPESTANILGAALGAGIAVWGAAWITSNADRKARAAALASVDWITAPLARSAAELVELIHQDLPETQDRTLAVQKAAAAVWVDVDQLGKRIASLDQVMLQLGSAGVLAHADISHIVEHMREDRDTLDHLVTGKFAYEERIESLRGIATSLHAFSGAIGMVVSRMKVSIGQ